MELAGIVGPRPLAAVPRSVALRLKLELAAPALRAAISAYWQSGDPRARYLGYLRMMHTVLRASVPLMESAAARCAERAGHDPVAAPLRGYLLSHIAEERGHDAWLVQDLRAAGGAAAALATAQPAPTVAALAGAQYYWINHHHPVCLLGYIAVLEGHAPRPRLAARLQARTGLPAEAFATMVHHAEVDADHTAQLYRLLDTLPLTEAQESALSVTALHTVTMLTTLFTDEAAQRGPAADPPHTRTANLPAPHAPAVHPCDPRGARS